MSLTLFSFHGSGLGALSIGEANEEAESQADHNRRDAMGPDSRRGAGQAEVVGEGGTGDHAEHKDPGIRIPFAGHEELSAGAAARQGKGEPRHDHAREVPECHAVGDGLFFETRVELPQNQVGQQGGGQECHEP